MIELTRQQGQELRTTSLLDEMAAKAGWDDPALVVYNDMIPQDR
jgi:hypothetical protein